MRWLAPSTSWVVLLAGLVLSGLALALLATADTSTDRVAALPDDAESTLALRAQEQLPAATYVPAIVVLDRGGDPLTTADRTAVAATLGQVGRLAAEGQEPFPAFSEDGRAALVGVPLSTDLSDEQQRSVVEQLRAVAAQDLPDGLDARVTGGPAFQTDLASVFDGANVKLLLTTAGVVALLLLLTYRSPWLWLVPLMVVGLADQVAAKLVGVAVDAFGFTIDGSTIGITSVLVFGAGTNYALLLIARYREELRLVEDRYDAMRVALSQAAPAILASSSTVVLALLSLGFAVTPTNRGLGFSAAIGIGTAVVFTLVLLPAALLVLGRGLFWPFVPRVGQQEPTRQGFWAKVGHVVTRRPVPVAVGSVLILAVLASGIAGLQTGLSQTEQFREKPESVTGQQVLAEHFPAGSSGPTTIVTTPERVDAVRAAAEEVDGVTSVRPSAADDRTVELAATLSAAPASEGSLEQVAALRSAVQDADSAALVGGADAQALDAKDAASHDLRVIIPLILAIVLVVLLLLLRSVVAAVVLVLTVVASFAASLGAGWFAFSHWFGFPATDLGVPLLSFLFLVALGVDYNIFLATRAREEAATADARTSIATSLAVTGGVITSAGILLAAVFTVLGVLPLITLTQIGIIVGFGVLLDTLLVRSLLVPSLVALIGDRFWWPGNPRGRGRHRTGRPTTPTQSEHPPPVRGEVLVGRAGPPG
jgi:putative drug exporter of the RND superfamily